MADRPGFDFGRLSMGTKGALIVGGVSFINLLIPWWNTLDLGPFGGGGGISGFNGLGVLAGILLIGVVVWEGLGAAGTLDSVNAPKKMVTAGLAAGGGLFMLIRGLIKPSAFGVSPYGYGIGSFVGIALGLVLLYVAYVAWQEHQTASPGASPPAPPPAT